MKTMSPSFLRTRKPKPRSRLQLKIYNGRIKVYCDAIVMFTFNQIDFKGYYAYKDDTDQIGRAHV